MAAAKTAARDTTAEIAFLTRALKAPTLRESVPRLAERARAESWSHEEFLAACLQREVAARESESEPRGVAVAVGPGRVSGTSDACEVDLQPRYHLWQCRSPPYASDRSPLTRTLRSVQ